MDEKPKSGGQWGDYVALAVGAGTIAYFTRVDREALARSTESWTEAAIFLACMFAGMGILIYGILRAWDGFIGWLKRQRG